MPDYSAEVDRQVARNEGKGGWAKGPESICSETLEETVDIAAWLRGLDRYPMTWAQRLKIDAIVNDAALLFEEIDRLKNTYK